MIISHASKYIFIHIPKTAGTSIELYLKTIDDPVVFTDDFSQWPQGLVAHLKHRTLQSIKKIWGDNIYTSYYKWTVVRNPFDAIVSMYNWCLVDMRDKKQSFPFTDVNDFILNNSENCFVMASFANLIYNQHKFLLVDGKIGCETFRYEDGFDNIMRRVSTVINNNNPNFPILENLPVKHNTHTRKDRRHYREILSAESRGFIETKASKDFEIFGYEW